MNINNKIKRSDIFFGLLFYIFTLGILPNTVYLIWAVLIIICHKQKIKIYKNERVVILIIILSIINELLGVLKGNIPDSYIDYVPYSLLILITIISSKEFNKNIATVFIYCVIIEIFIGLIEKKIGIFSIYETSERDLNGLLYNSRVSGLTTSPSGYAAKIMLALLLYEFYKIKKINKIILYTIIFLGLIVSFNRTFFSASLLFIFLNVLTLKEKRKSILYILIGLIIILLIFILNANIGNIVINQFTRGVGTIDAKALSERDIIYKSFLDFISNNFYFGNNSFKYIIDLGDGRTTHAHNSFLQTLANNGFIIFIFYLYVIIANINKFNYIYIIPILLSSLFQTFILWGISYGDIIFYLFLFSNNDASANRFATLPGPLIKSKKND